MVEKKKTAKKKPVAKRKPGRPKAEVKLYRVWSRAKVMNVLRQLLDDVRTNTDIITIKGLFVDKDYSYNTFKTTLNTRYSKDLNIKAHWEKIKEILEDRIVSMAARGDLQHGFARFLLSSSYGYMEEHQRQARKVEHTITQNNQITLISERKRELLAQLAEPTVLPEPVDVIDIEPIEEEKD